MEKNIKKLTRNSMIISVLLIILAFCMIFKPVASINVLMLIFGWVLVIDGIVHFITYLDIGEGDRIYSFELAQAVMDIVFGFFIVMQRDRAIDLLSFILGIWILFDGIAKLQIAFNIRGFEGSKWGVMASMALISMFFGIMLLLNTMPLQALVRVAGCMLALTEMFSIFDDVYILGNLRSIDKEIKKIEKSQKKNA